MTICEKPSLVKKNIAQNLYAIKSYILAHQSSIRGGIFWRGGVFLTVTPVRHFCWRWLSNCQELCVRKSSRQIALPLQLQEASNCLQLDIKMMDRSLQGA